MSPARLRGIVLSFALCLFALLPAAARASVEDGLVGYWKFDDMSSAPQWQPTGGQIGGALEFDGVKQRVNLDGLSDLDFSQENAFTIAAWVYSNAPAPAWQTIFTRGSVQSSPAGTGYFLATNGADPTKLYTQISDGTNTVTAASSPGVFNYNVWQHFVMRWDGTTLSIYKNGISVGSATNAAFTGLWNVPTTTSIGADFGGSRAYFKGLIDDVRAYNRALTPAEITDLYNDNSPTTTGLVGYWSLDESSGLIAADSSGGGNDGTLDVNGYASDSAGNNPGALQGGVTYISPSGIHGGGMGSDGAALTKISLGEAASLHNYNAITIAAWINPASIDNQNRIIDNISGVNFSIGDLNSTDSLQFTLLRGNNVSWETNASTIASATWQHVAVTFDFTTPSSKPQFYLNGQAIATPDAPAWASVSASSGAVTIAGRVHNSYNFNGKMDDVRIYNRALSATEIKELYEARCVDPVGKEGDIYYDQDAKVPAYCDGRDWVAFTTLNVAAGGGACTNPAGEEGDMFYNTSGHILQYCAGEWIPVGAGAANLPVGGPRTGFFVMTNGTFTGNFIAEAASKSLPASGPYGDDEASELCLDDLTNNDWMGKADAQARGLLNASHVRAFICLHSAHGPCQTLLANTEYFFALSGDVNKGGASFTTDVNSQGPGDNANWSDSNYFGTAADYWTGRSAGSNTLWSNAPIGSGADNCLSWTNPATTGDTGKPNNTGNARWYNFRNMNCATPNHLVCMVNP